MKLPFRCKVRKKPSGSLGEVTAAIENVMTQGRKTVDELLRQTPTDLRQEILALDEEMRVYRFQQNPPKAVGTGQPLLPPDPSLLPGPFGFQTLPPLTAFSPTQLPAVTQTQSQPFQGEGYYSQPSRFLDGLEPDKLAWVAAPDKHPTEFQQLVQQMVETQIVKPHFDLLNQKKQAQLDAPLAKIEGQLAGRARSLAAQFGDGKASFEANLGALTHSMATLRTMQLAPPAGNPEWWRSFEGKGEVAEANRLNVDQVVTESKNSLGQMSETMNAAGLSLQQMLDGVKQERTKLEAKLAEVENQYQDAHKLMGELGRPFTFITARLDQAVGGFPAVSLLLCAWLLWRLNRLRAQGAFLSQAFGQYAVSDTALKAAIPAIAQPVVLARTSSRWLVVVVSGVLILAGSCDVFVLRNTSAFPNATGMAIFSVAALLLAGLAYASSAGAGLGSTDA